MSGRLGERIAALVAPAIERGDLPGCVVLVGRRAGIVFEEAYGDRSVEPVRVAMTTDTLFDLASLTKPIAAATSAMVLVERGQLRLQDKVAQFFPEFAAHGKQDVTIEQLMVHSAGLIPDNPLADYHDGWASTKPKICDLEPIAEPGKTFKYSDVGFILLGKIIEEISGKPVDQFARDEVFSKLGLRETGYLPSEELRLRAAPTEQRDGQWLVGEVHDPRAAKMGGVAGHAGLFGTASELAIYAQMMLQRGRYGDIQLLAPATVAEMTRARNIGGQRRGLGWDRASAYSRNRGETMSRQAFGHGGFTGTVIWIDPGLDLYVIFLSNRLHPDGVGDVNDLAGRIGTIAVSAIVGKSGARGRTGRLSDQSNGDTSHPADGPRHPLRLGIDVLVADGFKQLRGKRVGLITNHTGRDSHGVATAERIEQAEGVELVALFSPEHGIGGRLDAHVGDAVDERTGLPIYSLYGENRRPASEQLAGVDVLVFDIQDIGTRFYTYISTMSLAMEAAAEAGKEFVVLDRPNPINGTTIEGPLLDAGRETFVGCHPLPVRHGMTIGELALMFAAEKRLELPLTVVPMEGWRRWQYWHDTQLEWVNPSPNMRSPVEALLYPGIGLLETTNVSVGRGTDTPFEVLGAPWLDGRRLAEFVNRRRLPGVRLVPIRFTPTASKFSGESCGGVRFVVTDWDRFRAVKLGLTLAHALRTLHHDDWAAEPYIKLLGSEAVFQRVLAGNDAASILRDIQPQLREFRERRKPFMLYP
jgi:uncharacterized protein YbbC (DUF1343 family)/CubicO group peptidase (beta-lactamase class C family)